MKFVKKLTFPSSLYIFLPMKIPGSTIRNFFTDNGRRNLERQYLLENPTLAKTLSSIAKLYVKDRDSKIKSTCTGFVIDKEGFLLGPEYLLKAEDGDTLEASITTLRQYLPSSLSSEHIGRFGDEGIVQIDLPVVKIFEDKDYDIALLKVVLPEVQDPWNVASFYDEKFNIGHETFTLSEGSFTLGQFIHPNFSPKFSFITTNEIERDEVGSPCLYEDKILGIATRYMNGLGRRAFGFLNMASTGSLPNRLFRKITYNLSHLELNAFIKKATDVNLFSLEEGETLMSSNKVKRAIENLQSKN